MANEVFLGTGDGARHWMWTGARLSPEGGIGATVRFADLSWAERRRRLAEAEAAWLGAQWRPGAPGTRIEVRSAVGPGSDTVRSAVLVRTIAATEDGARAEARERLERAAGPTCALPPHVGAEPMGSPEELRAWLELPGEIGSVVEVRKQLSVGQVRRGGSPLRSAACHGNFAGGAEWDSWWRDFAALPFPAVLCVGFEAYDASAPAFRGALTKRVGQLSQLAADGVGSPLFPQHVPADPAAEAALPGCQRALDRYSGRCFLVRISLVCAQAPPPLLVEQLVRTVSQRPGDVRAVQVLGPEFDEAVREHKALGAPWLAGAYEQGLPVALDGLDRLLHSVADVTEAAALLSLPVHWPGMPRVFSRHEGVANA